MKVSIVDREEVDGIAHHSKTFFEGSPQDIAMIMDHMHGELDEPVEFEPTADMHANYQALELAHHKLMVAVHGVYYAAYWKADRPITDIDGLWAALRDAASIDPSTEPAALGPNRHAYVDRPKTKLRPPAEETRSTRPTPSRTLVGALAEACALDARRWGQPARDEDDINNEEGA